MIKYWNFCDEMSVYDGLVLKGHRVIDNFEIDGMTFLLIVDKFSKFLIVRECSLDTSYTNDML